MALSGYSTAGKDTAAEGLIAVGWRRVAFADKLRELALAIDPWVTLERSPMLPVRLSSVVDTLGWHEAKKHAEVRRLLQAIGAGVRDVLGENIWVDAALSDLPEGDVVITDCRYRNEARAVQAAGGRVVRVERPKVQAVNGHESETALDGFSFDGYVINDLERDAVGTRLRVLVDRLYHTDTP